MSWEINASTWTRQLSSPFYDGNFTNSLRPEGVTAVSMTLSLSTAGRLGFFIDYSELSDAGTHTFYVCRTHGSTGAVSVDYSTGGDGHNTTSGTITWADGEMDIKSFTVEVTSAQLTNHQTTLGLGEHRIWALLSNPTNGGVLHFGTEHTRAYGVIDNDVLASDANAVFYDSAAVTNGTGTQASPYNSVYDAIAAIGSKRYLYGQGTTAIDGTVTDTIQGSPPVSILPPPATRTGESDRVYIRNWSGNTWSITSAGGTSTGGFFADAGQSYHTYKGIDFSNLNNTTASAVFGIFYLDGSAAGINIELCTADNLNGAAGSNNGAYMLWGVDGGKVWRCTSNNIQTDGDNTNQNTALFFTFDGVNLSVQRCESLNSATLVYHKRTASFVTSTSVRFCIDSTPSGVRYAGSGAADAPHSYTIVQCNLFLKPSALTVQSGIVHKAGDVGANGSNNATKHWWCNNVFYERGSGETAAISSTQSYDAAIFNNIMLDCRKVWANPVDNSAFGPDIELADYQCEFGTTLLSQRYEWKAVDYTTAALLNAVNPAYAGNDINQDPLFTNPSTGDFTLQGSSPALTSGVDGTQQGLYLGDFYIIGAN